MYVYRFPFHSARFDSFAFQTARPSLGESHCVVYLAQERGHSRHRFLGHLIHPRCTIRPRLGEATFRAPVLWLLHANVGCQAVLESGGQIKKKQAYELMTTNLEKLLDLEGRVGEMGELVAYDGGSALEFSSKPIAIVAPARSSVEVL